MQTAVAFHRVQRPPFSSRTTEMTAVELALLHFMESLDQREKVTSGTLPRYICCIAG